MIWDKLYEAGKYTFEMLVREVNSQEGEELGEIT